MGDFVSVREVGLRDGLQLIRTRLDTATKLQWIKAQVAIGFSEMEVTSFVPAKLLPQFADAGAVLGEALRLPGLTASVLVPNLRGGLLARQAGAKKITFVLSASEAHNQSNVRRSTGESLAMFRELAEELGRDGEPRLTGAIATSFGCSMQGAVAESRVLEIAEELAKAGASEINLADTVGYANPKQVRKLFSMAGSALGDLPLAAHFHDTRGFGLANLVAALEAGVRRFDAALGGLGGCPFAPGASGNIATEDTVHLVSSMGMQTDIALEGLMALRRQLADWLPQEQLHGKLLQAGLGQTGHKTA